jgi:hypothetical protein
LLQIEAGADALVAASVVVVVPRRAAALTTRSTDLTRRGVRCKPARRVVAVCSII